MTEEEDFQEETPKIVKKETPKKFPKGKKYRKRLLVNLQRTHYDLVHQVFADLGWEETESEEKCTMYWTDAGGSSDVCSTLLPFQFYNHFFAIWSIARKVEMLRNYEKLQSQLPDIYTFQPKSFLLPGQYAALKTFMLAQAEKQTEPVTFIVKPDRGAQGRGIFLIQEPEQAEHYSESAVVQQYISPFLIDGYKFDLRLYVLITAVSPLRMYFHNEGMARFCTEPYVVPTSANLSKVYGHLTNYSLNKKNDHFQKNTDPNDATKGSKRSYSFVLDTIRKMGLDTKELQRKIDRIIRLTVASIQPRLEHHYKATVSVSDDKCRCFEILGFDILLDANLEPWLIEVNNMPSLSTDSPFDKKLKESVLKGTLTILDIPKGFKQIVADEEKAVTQMRITGATDLPRFKIFDPEKESEIAKTTNWRQIYPLEPDDPETEVIETAIKVAKSMPVVGPIETTTTKARKEHIDQVTQEIEKKEKEAFAKRKFSVKKSDITKPVPQKKKKLIIPPYKPERHRLQSLATKKSLSSYLQGLNQNSLFRSMKGNAYRLEEEKSRLSDVKKQQNAANDEYMMHYILQMLNVNSPPPESADSNSQKGKSKKQFVNINILNVGHFPNCNFPSK